MANIDYSIASLDTLCNFHMVKHVVFVEGQEDVRFWDSIFTEIDLKDYKIKIAGGKSTLNKYADAILKNDAMIVVASDLDFSDLDGTIKEHKRILYTYGYSIENTLCGLKNLAIAILNLSYSTSDIEKNVVDWICHIEDTLKPLVHLDVLNRVTAMPHKIPLQKVERLQCCKQKHLIDTKKVHAEVNKIKQHFTDEQHESILKLLSSSKKTLIWHIRGHFLISASLYLIKHYVYKLCGRKITLSNEALYALLLGQFRLGNCEPQEKAHFENIVKKLIAC